MAEGEKMLKSKLKLRGLKEAIGDYRRANRGGHYSPQYGYLMLDASDGKIWTDEFYSLGRNEWKQYHSESIVNLGRMMDERDIKINMANVKKFVEENF